VKDAPANRYNLLASGYMYIECLVPQISNRTAKLQVRGHATKEYFAQLLPPLASQWE